MLAVKIMGSVLVVLGALLIVFGVFGHMWLHVGRRGDLLLGCLLGGLILFTVGGWLAR